MKPSDLKPSSPKPPKSETGETHMYVGVVYGPGDGTPSVGTLPPFMLHASQHAGGAEWTVAS